MEIAGSSDAESVKRIHDDKKRVWDSKKRTDRKTVHGYGESVVIGKTARKKDVRHLSWVH